MRASWIRSRVFVHATEDEDRVRRALLWSLGQGDDPKAAPRVVRMRTKGHYGNEIVVLEAGLERRPDIESGLGHVFGEPRIKHGVLATLSDRIDDEGVLHLRLDKQAAVQGRLELGPGSDTFSVRIKTPLFPGTRPEDAWRGYLEPSD